MIVLTSFMLVVLSLLMVSYWAMVKVKLKMAKNKQAEIRALYAARSGVADAVDELRSGNDWSEGSLDTQWVKVNETTFYKSSLAPTPLVGFDYPVTYSVTVEGNPETERVSITSKAEVLYDSQQYQQQVDVTVVRSLANEITFISTTE
jgi:Tfp pilus assembly protein PilX